MALDLLTRGRKALSDWTYQMGPGRYYQPAYRHIAAAVTPGTGTFLDLCCGPGWLAIHVAAGHPEVEVIGIDHSARMLDYANQNRSSVANVSFRHMKANALVYPDGTFHAAASIQAAHHWIDPPAILAEAHRVLASGGHFYIYEADSALDHVPAGWVHRTGRWPPSHFLRYNWRRFGMDDAEWAQLKAQVSASPFGGGKDGRHGFYRRLILTRA